MSIDGASVEVIRSYLISAADEMRSTLIRTAFNPVIYEVLDFGISVYDDQLRLVAEAAGLTQFLGANDYSLRKGVEYVGAENLHAGDVVMLNYPYWNAAHALDATLFAPVFHEETLIGYLCVRAHWMDLGAKDAGYVLDSTDMHQEGLIFPGTKVFQNYEPDHQITELIRFNSRMPDLVIGDLNAQVAALRTGEKRLQEIHTKFGSPTVAAAIDSYVAHSAETAAEAVRGLPEGSWTAEEWMDDDGVSDDPVLLKVTVTIADGTLTCDFTGSAAATRGPVNLPLGATIANCRVAFKALTTPTEQSNAGHFAPLKVITEPGTIFHAVYPAATFTQWTGNLAVELIYKALAQGMPERIAACSGGDIPGFMMVGDHPDTGGFFAISNNDLVGWGATAQHDGFGPGNHITQTAGHVTPIEVLEMRSGMIFERLEIREDSGGAGQFRGGPGVRRDIRFRSPGEFLSVIKRTKSKPWGLEGGLEPDATTVLAYADSAKERPVSTKRLPVDVGDRMRLLTAGGGGHGDPRLRSREAVLEDIAEGLVSPEQARAVYGLDEGEAL